MAETTLLLALDFSDLNLFNWPVITFNDLCEDTSRLLIEIAFTFLCQTFNHDVK